MFKRHLFSTVALIFALSLPVSAVELEPVSTTATAETAVSEDAEAENVKAEDAQSVDASADSELTTASIASVDETESDAESKPTVIQETPGYDVRNSIVRVITGYEFDDGSFDEWTSGFGFLIAKDCALITRNSAIIEQDSQLYRQIVAERYDQYKSVLNVDLKDFSTAVANIHTYVLDGATRIEATVNSAAGGDSFAVLSLTSRINSKETVTLSDRAMQNDDIVYAIGTESDKELPSKLDFFGRKSKVTGIRKNRASEYVEFEGSFGTLSAGCPLVDVHQVVVGLITDGSGGKGSAVDIRTIETALDAANVEYRSKGERETPVDTDLESLISKAGAIDRSKYTEESLKVLDTAVAQAQAVISDSDASRNRIEKASAGIEEAISGLTVIDRSKAYIKLATYAAVFLAIVAVLIFLFIKIRDKDKNDWELEEEREARKAKREERKKKKPVKKSSKKTKDDDQDADDETGVLDDDDGDSTGVLNDNGGHAWLVQSSTGRRIDLTKNRFVIGKSSGDVDFRIVGNGTVSRKHCQILKRGTDYYVEDLGSTNGTYIDGAKLEPNDPGLISDGQKLLISDERFVFEQSSVPEE